jgi:NAD(P)-dependent dehydrogenase (short-subunit alcohol dehydrogenase family)
MTQPFPQPRFDLDGRVALVTGASRGIGHDLALAIALAGARVMVAARATAELAALVDAIGVAGGEADAVALDLTDAVSIGRPSGPS